MDENRSAPVRVYRLSELPGRMRKFLNVPSGGRGVVRYPDGEHKTFPPGRHRVLSAWEWLRGRGAGLVAGIVAMRPVPVWAEAQNLLSGDGELLDALLLCEAEIGPDENALAAFFAAGVSHEKERLPVITLDSTSAGRMLAAIVRRYTAADLLAGLPGERLHNEIASALAPLLSEQGLQVASVRQIAFIRAADRTEIAEKALDIRMAELDVQTRRLDIERGFADELGTPETADGVSAPAAESSSEDSKARFYALYRGQNGERGLSRLRALFHREKSETPSMLRHRYPRYWWLGRALWMLFILLTALAITGIINFVATGAENGDRWNVILAVWGFAIATWLESIKSLYQKRERLSEEHWMKPGRVFIDDLVGKDRSRADALVRGQCAQDMENICRVLNDLRSRVYRAGNSDLALRIKRLETKAENTAEDLRSLDFGPAPYLTDLKIGHRTWETMLDYDETLLARSADLGENALTLQQHFGKGNFDPTMLDALETALDTFRHRFAARGQVLKRG